MTAAGGGAAELARADRDVVLADLHREHYRSLVRLACVLLDEQGAGEEVVQEAFVRVFQAWPKVEQPLTYLRSTVMNLARSRMRRKLVARRRVEPVGTPGMSAEERVVLLDDQQEVLDAMRTLPRRQRECLVLRYYLDLSETEIASTLGISNGSVKSHSSRGLAALARRLEARR
ncbi:MAG: SigE family RNA polymerase sigma factor [Acidimicrobiia bacterium]